MSTLALKPTLEERFWSKVNKAEPGCWEWTGSKLSKGYGSFWDGTKVVRAHRFCYRLLVGPIPDGLFVCHSCDNPSCVNPKHLFIGDAKDNMLDMTSKGRGVRPVLRPAAKLTIDSVQEIRRSKYGATVAASIFGVSKETIYRIRRGESWVGVA